MTDCAHCVWLPAWLVAWKECEGRGQRAEGRGHDARTSCCQVNANAQPQGATTRRHTKASLPREFAGSPTRHAAKLGGRSRVARSLHICTSFWPLPKTRERQKAEGSPLPQGALGLCAQRKLQCVFNLWQRIGYETETLKLKPKLELKL